MARDLLTVTVARTAMSAVVLAGGFRAVSDDDFARIVHMQEFALAPALDPTGTSWLPFPFWVSGGAMLVLGTSVAVARGVAVVLGLASALLVYAAARLLVESREGALAGALIACAFPWAARLGVATVPELPAAALSLFAVATLARDRLDYRLLGALALLAATLCRYEPWLLSLGFVAFTALDAWREGGRGGRRRRATGWWGAAAVALAGPAAWILHNAASHGDPLHFVARVSAYKRALSGVPDGLWALAGYPVALLREEPELCLVTLTLLGLARWTRRRGGDVHVLPSSFRRPALCLALMVTLLGIAAIVGGAPTHHAGRAMLAVWLMLALVVGEGARRALRSAHRWPFALFVCALMPLGALVLRPWYARLDSFITRADEVAIGMAVSRHVAERRALVEVHDYGYFAVQAGSGVPPRLVPDREVDPRRSGRASSFVSVAAIHARAREIDAGVVIAHLTPVTRELGAPVATFGSWGAWLLPPGHRSP